MRMDLRARPARCALAAAMGLAATATGAGAVDRFAVEMPGAAGSGAGVAALMHSVRAAAAPQRRPAGAQGASVRTVTDCGDGAGPGTLRAVLAQAGGGDTIDLSQLQCSTITLSQGAVQVLADHVTLVGPGADRLALVGNGQDRVLLAYAPAFTVRDLSLSDGVTEVTGYHVTGGACILAAYDVTLERATVSACTASGEGAYGGAILAGGITLRQSTLTGNLAQGTLLPTLTASYGGGAFAYQAEIRLYDSTVSGNFAQADTRNFYGHYDTGGGVFSDRGGYFYRSTVSGNSCDGTGGGFATHGGVRLIDSTISNNYAGRRGGGLFLRSVDASQVSNSTIAFNRAVTAGGGMYVVLPPLSFVLQSSIVADNGAITGPDIASRSALALTGSNDLVLAASADVTLPPETLRSDPLLLPLAANGGVTRTHALAPGSPAIDRGSNPIGLAFDQRGAGFPRRLGTAADIGAFEAPAGGVAPTLVPAPTLSVWATLALAMTLLGAGARRRCKRM